MGEATESGTTSNTVDVRSLLDPAMRDALGSFDLPDMNAEVLRTIRSSPLPATALSGRVERSDHLVPGEPTVPVRLHRPTGADGTLPAILTIHGGGYIIGSYDMDDAMLDRWCQNLSLVGISVQYRLAPETPYPGAVEDCYAALRWAYQHADELGIDAACIGIQGISAGGGLAAALALLARTAARYRSPFSCSTARCSMTAKPRLRSALTASMCGLGLLMRSAGARTLVLCTDRPRCRPTQPRHAPRICPICHQHVWWLERSTDSVTKILTMRNV